MNNLQDTKNSQPEQEPVAWRTALERIADPRNTHFGNDARVVAKSALDTTPPQRTWVGLTEEEVEACFHHVDEAGIGLFDFAEAIEAKLKEKNT